MNVTGNRDQTDCLDRAAEAIVGLINRQPRSPSALDIRNLLQNFVLQRPTESQQNTDLNERLEAAAEGAGCLARAHKMNDLAHLATGLAHDLHTLLTVINGHAQLIKKRLRDEPRIVRSAEAIETATQRGDAAIRQLRSFSRVA